MRGYWQRPDATADTIVYGWLHTGDMGRVDEDGYFFIVDRKKELIIRGGYNVYPREVEEVLYEHPAVREAAVLGIPHDEYGEEIGAAVSLADGAQTTPEELREYVRERVAAYKYPRAGVDRRRAAQGADGQDPQARDRAARPGVSAAAAPAHGRRPEPLRASRRRPARVRARAASRARGGSTCARAARTRSPRSDSTPPRSRTPSCSPEENGCETSIGKNRCPVRKAAV